MHAMAWQRICNYASVIYPVTTKNYFRIRRVKIIRQWQKIRRIRTMALETFKIVNKIAPVCLQNVVSVKNSKYSLRYVNVLDVPRVKSTHYGKKSFKFAAATLWNSLPNHFRTENSFFHILKVWSGPGMIRNVAVLLADSTFVLAAFHLLLLFVTIHYWTVIAVFFCLISAWILF